MMSFAVIIAFATSKRRERERGQQICLYNIATVTTEMVAAASTAIAAVLLNQFQASNRSIQVMDE